MIPRIMHVVWVGDESKRPNMWINTWKKAHPSWRFLLWGNADLAMKNWKLKTQLRKLAKKALWHGVADLMRYEILNQVGGVYVDADTECLRPIDELLEKYTAFAAMEHETIQPGLVANSIIGCEPGNPVMAELIRRIGKRRNPRRSGPFSIIEMQRRREAVAKAVGPYLFTKVLNEIEGGFKILPSSTFYPHYHDGTPSPYLDEGAPSFARQHWGSTTGAYVTGSYVGHPETPVNMWKQRDAIEHAIQMMVNQGKEDMVEALRAAWWHLQGHIEEL